MRVHKLSRGRKKFELQQFNVKFDQLSGRPGQKENSFQISPCLMFTCFPEKVLFLTTKFLKEFTIAQMNFDFSFVETKEMTYK